MENKPQTLFEKLDKQDEKLDDISQKLDGVSMKDLYALAKRTWDYGDFVTAQKYYNHISLLNPLDWKAPLFASLCNYNGSHNLQFWKDSVAPLKSIYGATLEYIFNLDYDDERKEKELSDAITIIEGEIKKYKDLYNQNKSSFDDWDRHSKNKYPCLLEKMCYDLYCKFKNDSIECIKSFCVFLSNTFLELITMGFLSTDISRENYNDIAALGDIKYKNSLDLDAVFNQRETAEKNNIGIGEMKKIKLKGEIWFKYYDDVLYKRFKRSELFLSSMFSFISITGIVFAFFLKWYYAFIFLPMLIVAILKNIYNFTQKGMIKCSSRLYCERKKNRLTSDKGIVMEDKKNIIYFILVILCMGFSYAGIIIGSLMIASIKATDNVSIIIGFCGVLCSCKLWVNAT